MTNIYSFLRNIFNYFAQIRKIKLHKKYKFRTNFFCKQFLPLGPGFFESFQDRGVIFAHWP